MFRFAQPYAFLLFIPFLVAAWCVYRKTVRAGLAFSAIHRLPSHTRTWRMVVAGFLPSLFLAGLVLAIFAMARPQTVFSRVRDTTDAIAIAMVLDVSGSMEALDMSDIVGNQIVTPRTRLDMVKKTFSEFVKQRPDDLIGLVTFGGYASTRVPLTADHEALLHVLDGVEIPKPNVDANGQLTDPDELNTALGDALATGVARLEDAALKTRIVVLLSDGSSNTGIIKPEEALHAARKLGLKIYAIGVGSNGPVPVYGRDMFGRRGITTAVFPIDEALLKKLADDTGGRYFNVRDPKGLEQAVAEINQLEKTEVERNVYYQYHELFTYLLGPALGLMVLAAGLNIAVSRRMV
jgi:Ca-activated chloride channel family protein